MRARLMTLVATAALVVAACGSASGEVADDGGLASGIGVHGAWTIDVYEEDGTLGRSASFTNDLTSTGEEVLADLLTGERAAGSWVVWLDPASGDPEPCTYELNSPRDEGCTIADSGYEVFNLPGGGAVVPSSPNLSVEQGDGVDVVLSGSVEVDNTTSIGEVSAHIEACFARLSPSECGTDVEFFEAVPFTSTLVSGLDWDGDGTANDGVIPVKAGQTVQVTVTLSFGTLP